MRIIAIHRDIPWFPTMDGISIPEDQFLQDLEDIKKLEEEVKNITNEQYENSIQDLWTDWSQNVDEEDRLSTIENTLDDIKLAIASLKISQDDLAEELRSKTDRILKALEELKKNQNSKST